MCTIHTMFCTQCYVLRILWIARSLGTLEADFWRDVEYHQSQVIISQEYPQKVLLRNQYLFLYLYNPCINFYALTLQQQINLY